MPLYRARSIADLRSRSTAYEDSDDDLGFDSLSANRSMTVRSRSRHRVPLLTGGDDVAIGMHVKKCKPKKAKTAKKKKPAKCAPKTDVHLPYVDRCNKISTSYLVPAYGVRK